MAAIDFPASPTVGQLFTPASGVTYRWNGTLWLATGGTSAGGDFCALLPGPTALPTTASVATTMPVVSGNSGGWYIPATGRFTPPAGRYLIYASMYAGGAGGASVVIIQMRKNAVVIQSSQETAQGSSWINPETQVTCDANGTDVFDMTIQSTVTGNNALQVTFSAFPISGIQGPPGPPPLGSLSLYSESILNAPAATVDVTVPRNCKRIDLQWGSVCVGGVDGTLYIQGIENGTPTQTGYSGQIVYGYGVNAYASSSRTNTAGLIMLGLKHWAGTVNLMPFPASGGMCGSLQAWGQDTAAVKYSIQHGFNTLLNAANLTGFRLINSASSPLFDTGSFLRAYVVT